MAAGLGFKTFNTGDVLSAADVNGYLMQGVLVFADAAARDAAITSPQEGQFAYTKDTNGLWYYSGSAWVASGATGDIEGVTAGTGISGGGTSGTVTITNSMATAIDAKGDLIVGTGSDTFSKLTVGTNTYVLTADSAEATGLKWAAPSGGGSTFVGAKSTRIGSAAQSISNNTFTAVLWTADTYDTDSIHDTSSNTDRFTIPAGKGGKWAISASVLFAGSSSGERRIAIYKNGASATTDQRINGQGTGGLTASVNSVFNLVATDYLSVYVYQDSGGSLNIDEDLSWCSIYYLGA